MATDAEMTRMNEQELMAWIPAATLEELRRAQSYPINSGVLRAIQSEVHRRDAADALKASDEQNARRFWIATGIALVALAVSVVALVK